MSWLFSQALVAAYSEATCLGGEPSAPLSGNPTRLAYLPPDRMTAFSRPSRSGMTFKPLTDDLGAAVLTWCLEASRAKTSALQAKAQELTENDQACGATWRGSLARFDPATSSWRTAQPSLLEDLGESSVIWPRSGMTANGQCSELPMLGRRTSETDSGLWPTPTASAMPCEGTQRIMRNKWLAGEVTLEEASAIAGGDVRKAQGKVLAMWPSPKARDWKDGCSEGTMNRQSPDLGKVVGQSKQTGALNPTWVEWLMGWPLGWTDLKPLATDKFHSAPPPLGGS